MTLNENLGDPISDVTIIETIYPISFFNLGLNWEIKTLKPFGIKNISGTFDSYRTIYEVQIILISHIWNSGN